MNLFYNVQEHKEKGRTYIIYQRNLVTLIIYFALFIVAMILFFHYVQPEDGFFKAYSPLYVVVLGLWFLANFLWLWDSREIMLAGIHRQKTIQKGKMFSISQPYELWISSADTIEKTFPKLKGPVTRGLFFDRMVQKKDNELYDVLYNRPLGAIIFVCAWAIGMLVGFTGYMDSGFGVIIFLICWLVGMSVGIRALVEYFPIMRARFSGREVITVGANPAFHHPFQKIQYWIKKTK